MDKNKLINYINNGLSSYKIAKLENCGRSTVLYWLKKFKLKTKFYKEQIELTKPRKCYECGETDPTKFYGNKRTWCGKCHSKYTSLKGKEKKLAGVEYLGGKCSNCGYNKCIEALEFHHKDPTIKDAYFKAKRGWNLEKLKKELDNCILLCANCHRELHNKNK